MRVQKKISFGKKFHVDVFDAGCHGYDNGLNTLLKNHHNVVVVVVYIHTAAAAASVAKVEKYMNEQQKRGRMRVTHRAQ